MMDEDTRIEKMQKTVESLKETQQIGMNSDIDVSEQLINQLLEIEQLLGFDSSEPEDIYNLLADLISPAHRTNYEYDSGDQHMEDNMELVADDNN